LLVLATLSQTFLNVVSTSTTAAAASTVHTAVNTNTVNTHTVKGTMTEGAPFASMALGISLQNWTELGLGEDENVAASSDLAVTVERVTALLMIRILAWIQPRGKYTDLSTTCICRQTLIPQTDDSDNDSDNDDSWPFSMTPDVVAQLRQYVKVILSGYQTVPYHNVEHCYHVVISVNKLMDLILNCQDMNIPWRERPLTFGFKDDPLMQFALLFAAMIHDVEHQGIPNRQLGIENDVLAIQYNDQSIAEHRSLYIAFSELLKPDYKDLRSVIFPEMDDYRRFRKAVVNLVLTTDIASPERTQIGKSKWKEAFGDPYETVERKVRKQMERQQSLHQTSSSRGGAGGGGPRGGPGPGGPRGGPGPGGPRGPGAGGAGSGPAHNTSLHCKANRRMSAQSIMSELTLEAHSMDIDIGMEDDESVSATPDTSDDEGAGGGPKPVSPIFEPPIPSDGTPIFRRPVTHHSHSPVSTPNQGQGMRKMRRGGGGGNKEPEPPQARHKSLEMNTTENSLSGMAMKFHRRLSSIGQAAPSAKNYRSQRLGLLRTVDLTGEEIETYAPSHARRSATGAFASSNNNNRGSSRRVPPPEEVDELCESVVMEAILKAADVAHNMQSWEHMAKFSNRLFLELRRAYMQGRGEDAQNGWFSNQINFLEGYLLPVARRLDDTGVFGDVVGAMFAKCVEENRERWMVEGMPLTASIIREGDEIYPEEDSDEEEESEEEEDSDEDD
jgi:hypothetical protein